MKFPKALGASLVLFGMLFAFQLPFREFPGVEYRVGDISLPDGWQEKTEWAFARLMYPVYSGGGSYGGGGSRGGGGGSRNLRTGAADAASVFAAAGCGAKATPCGPRITLAPTAISCWPCAA